MATAAMTKVFVLLFLVAACYLPAHAAAAECDCATDTAGRDKAQAPAAQGHRHLLHPRREPPSGRRCRPWAAGSRRSSRRRTCSSPSRAFAGGVILATGLVHILPAAFEALSSPCLVGGPWKRFPFAGMVAMVSAIGTLIVDTVATGYFHRTDAKRKAAAVADEPADDLEASDEHSHGHAHGMSVMSVAPAGEEDLVRHRVISQALSSPCLVGGPWKRFPFAGMVAMVSAIGKLIVDTGATGYFHRTDAKRKAAAVADEPADDLEASDEHSHGHAHGMSVMSVAPAGEEDLVRHRVISQVLELGVVVHSLIIGMSLGASDFPSTVRPLVPALTFHQFFEGIGVGGCIVQAKFRVRSVVTMALFFSLTTPAGIVVGIGISSVYDANSPTALVVQGLLEAAAAGILVYMALVDILAEDFMKTKVQRRGRLQLAMNVALLLGAGLMSMIAIWA
ncbi:hypothetical protein OsJ_18891 [Oryza sativa Japonica Group]|uniref:Uncharacterized protein n=1 Tax=Oryza sativa subsp. japonica TaxID=39947 RepID=B9FKQ4_ORYSJ|nr:hypothetical protein OsJ_18891 [Oryza sativa Japonica Group]